MIRKINGLKIFSILIAVVAYFGYSGAATTALRDTGEETEIPSGKTDDVKAAGAVEDQPNTYSMKNQLIVALEGAWLNIGVDDESARGYVDSCAVLAGRLSEADDLDITERYFYIGAIKDLNDVKEWLGQRIGAGEKNAVEAPEIAEKKLIIRNIARGILTIEGSKYQVESGCGATAGPPPALGKPPPAE